MSSVRKFLAQKLGRDIVWTVGSFGVLAISGIIINLVITGSRDAAALGIFNLTYAVYVIASQIATMGIHYSVLRQTALLETDPVARGKMLASAALTALSLGAVVALAIEVSSPLLLNFFDSADSVIALRFAAWGLVLFPVTKVLIAFVNGARHMRAFSIFQATRYIVVMIWVTFISLSDRRFEEATLCFLVAESITILGASTYLVFKRELRKLSFDFSWAREHLTFGSKSLFAGMFVEMNARIDVLLLGIFLSDKHVGVYSFAAMLADGVYHLLAMIRVNFNPLLVVASRDQNWEEPKRLLNLTKKYLPIGTGAFSAMLVGALYVIAEFYLPTKGISGGLLSLFILLTGITLISPFIPFDNLLLASGFPSMQTLQQLVVLAVNAGLNLVLVPTIGIEGAAIGTAAGYIVGVIVLFRFAKLKISWDMFSNTTVKQVVNPARGV